MQYDLIVCNVKIPHTLSLYYNMVHNTSKSQMINNIFNKMLVYAPQVGYKNGIINLKHISIPNPMPNTKPLTI